MKRTRILRLASVFVILAASLATGFAQNFSMDARRIGMGGAGSSNNLASRMTSEEQRYTSIGIPLGLFQVLNNRKIFDPDDPEFDPVRAIEYAADPVHITLNRDTGSAGNRLITDLVQADLNRDLNSYRGFSPVSRIEEMGLFSPNWGKAFRVAGSGDVRHEIYAGAGPYVSLGTNLLFDQALINILQSSTNVYVPNTSFVIADNTTGQGAVAITGGYRVAFPVDYGGTQTGIRIATNMHYLRGLHYDAADLRLQLDTDAAGLITVLPATTPIDIDRRTSTSGNGFALDVAAAVVSERWEAGFSIDGIANRINWKELETRQYELQSLINGGDFVTTGGGAGAARQRVALPVRYTGSGSYHTDRWSAAADIGKGLVGFDFNAGGEYKVGPLALRSGARYYRELWHPAAGLGFNITEKIGIDAAAFQTSTNIERNRRISFALSLRIQHSAN